MSAGVREEDQMLAADVLVEMDRIMRDVPGGGYIGDYAEQGRDIWPERWRTLKTWLAHGIVERARVANAGAYGRAVTRTVQPLVGHSASGAE